MEGGRVFEKIYFCCTFFFKYMSILACFRKFLINRFIFPNPTLVKSKDENLQNSMCDSSKEQIGNFEIYLIS